MRLTIPVETMVLKGCRYAGSDRPSGAQSAERGARANKSICFQCLETPTDPTRFSVFKSPTFIFYGATTSMRQLDAPKRINDTACYFVCGDSKQADSQPENSTRQKRPTKSEKRKAQLRNEHVTYYTASIEDCKALLTLHPGHNHEICKYTSSHQACYYQATKQRCRYQESWR